MHATRPYAKQRHDRTLELGVDEVGGCARRRNEKQLHARVVQRNKREKEVEVPRHIDDGEQQLALATNACSAAVQVGWR